MTNTTFSRNSAEIAGGAIHASYLDAIRFRCSAAGDADLVFYRQREWQSLFHLKSVKDMCASWRHNQATNYGPNVGTYPAIAQMTIKGSKESKTESGEEYVFEEHRSGKEMPTMMVELLDELRQGPARTRRPVKASLSSLDDFLIGTVTIEMKHGTAAFRGIRGFVPAGDHNLTLQFDDETVESISIVVSVRNCSIGEVVSAGSLCADCSSTTYNFVHTANVCHPCPMKGNCEGRIILPDEGYWQKTPCSAHLRKCLTSHACSFEGRSDELTKLTEELDSCPSDEAWIQNYTQSQCAKASNRLRVSDSGDRRFFYAGLHWSTVWIL